MYTVCRELLWNAGGRRIYTLSYQECTFNVITTVSIPFPVWNKDCLSCPQTDDIIRQDGNATTSQAINILIIPCQPRMQSTEGAARATNVLLMTGVLSCGCQGGVSRTTHVQKWSCL